MLKDKYNEKYKKDNRMTLAN